MTAPTTLPPLTRIHVIFKTHLDIGFTAHAARVLQLYRERFIPQAMRVAARMRAAGGDRFIWTTGSFLVWDYLEHASPSARRQMEEAIAAGDIAWHALPFTTHTELMDAALVRTGLGLARQLDRRFGRTTVAAKMTDVTGHTRALVPLLAEAGVRLLHIGVNPASSFPQVPPLFRWRDPASGTQVLVMYHTTYGDLAHPGRAPQGTDGLVFAHTGDNQGPQDPDKLRHELAEARAAFPHAEVTASTLDAFARSLIPLEGTLPELTCEIGDNWIHGASTDPAKVAAYRALLRQRTRWRQQPLSAADEARLSACERTLLLVPEHTWGMDIKSHLKDERHFTNGDLARLRRTARARRVEASWQEQRHYLTQAVAALGRGTLAAQARQAISATRPRPWTRRGWQPLASGAPMSTRHFTVAVDAPSGALVQLTQGSHAWADAQHPLGQFAYQTFSAADFRRYYSQYARETHLHEWWIIRDITRYGMPDEVSDSAWWRPAEAQLRQRRVSDAVEIQATLRLPHEASHRYGCPRRIVLHYRFPDASPILELTCDWFDKRATRLPEAMWLSMRPLVADPTAWRLQKLGSWVEPLTVPVGGSRHLHAVDAARCADAVGTILITPLDSPLVAPGRAHLLDFDGTLPDLAQGLQWNLHNNTWCTNFPLWHEDDGRSRFTVAFAPAAR